MQNYSGFKPLDPYLMQIQWSIWSVTVIEQKHVDEVDEDAWCTLGWVDIKMTPFENNHEDQVAKKRENKNHLWNELKDNVYVFPEVAGKNQER